MRSSNPVLSDRAFKRVAQPVGAPYGFDAAAAPTTLATDRMTVEGTVYKTGLLLAIVVATAAWAWGNAESVILLPALGLSFFLLIGLAIATAFKPHWAIVTGPVYAAAAGVLLGAISALYQAEYEGIVGQAVVATIATAAAMLGAYATGLIRATPRFRKVIITATLGIMLVYVVSIVMNLFGAQMPLLHDSGPLGIGISLFIVGIAALNLILDFDFIERGAQAGADKRLEWYGAFGLMVTLVWLYLEMLRLLGKLRD